MILKKFRELSDGLKKVFLKEREELEERSSAGPEVEKRELSQVEADKSSETRRLVVIGDLHGDYYRLVRILEEFKLVSYESKENPLSFKWNLPDVPTDVVLLGDYVDWRGEPLEGPADEWIFGSYRILLLLSHLKKEVGTLAPNLRLFPLIGNHEDMMLKSFYSYQKLLEKFTEEELLELIDVEDVSFFSVFRRGIERNMSQEELNLLMEFLNWYVQGGKATTEGFGGLKRWLEEMQAGPVRSFLDELILLLRLGDILISHTLPDDFSLLKKLLTEGLESLSDEEREKIRVQFLWSRGIWGIDAFSNRTTKAPRKEVIEDLLESVNLRLIVIGHTPLKRYIGSTSEESLKPLVFFEGRIVNTDLHGIPMSEPYVEEYNPQGKEVMIIEDKTLRRYDG